MTLATRLTSKNARIRVQAKKEAELLAALAEELGKRKPWWLK